MVINNTSYLCFEASLSLSSCLICSTNVEQNLEWQITHTAIGMVETPAAVTPVMKNEWKSTIIVTTIVDLLQCDWTFCRLWQIQTWIVEIVLLCPSWEIICFDIRYHWFLRDNNTYPPQKGRSYHPCCFGWWVLNCLKFSVVGAKIPNARAVKLTCNQSRSSIIEDA